MYKAELVNSLHNNAEHLDYRHATYCHRNMSICRRHLIAVRGEAIKGQSKRRLLSNHEPEENNLVSRKLLPSLKEAPPIIYSYDRIIKIGKDVR
jgi:hypothetical protein